MGMSIGDANDTQWLLDYVLGGHKVSDDQAKAAAMRLADRSAKVLMAGERSEGIEWRWGTGLASRMPETVFTLERYDPERGIRWPLGVFLTSAKAEEQLRDIDEWVVDGRDGCRYAQQAGQVFRIFEVPLRG